MASPSWTKISSAPGLRRSSHTVSVIDGQVIVFGGELKPRQPIDNKVLGCDLGKGEASTVQVGEVATTTTVKPSPRVGSAAATLHGKLYVFSGRGGEAMKPIEEQGGLWTFDPATAEWSLLTPSDPSQPVPAARSYHCMTSDQTRYLYLHAGCPESGRLSDLWQFDPATRSWAERPAAPAPTRGGTSIAFARGELYRMNGFDGHTEQGGYVDVFDPIKSRWISKAFVADGISGPEARSVSVLVPLVLKDKDVLVTLFGERDPSSLGHAGAGKMLGDVWVYDIDDHAWQQIVSQGEQPLPRGWFDADALDANTIVVSGGLGESNERIDDIWTLSL